MSPLLTGAVGGGRIGRHFPYGKNVLSTGKRLAPISETSVPDQWRRQAPELVGLTHWLIAARWSLL